MCSALGLRLVSALAPLVTVEPMAASPHVSTPHHSLSVVDVAVVVVTVVGVVAVVIVVVVVKTVVPVSVDVDVVAVVSVVVVSVVVDVVDTVLVVDVGHDSETTYAPSLTLWPSISSVYWPTSRCAANLARYMLLQSPQSSHAATSTALASRIDRYLCVDKL